MSMVIKPYEAKNTTVSKGVRLRFFLGAATGIIAVLPNKVVKRHPMLPHNGRHNKRMQLVHQ